MPAPTNPRQSYRERRKFFDGLLTVYGRKPVLEALQDRDIPIHCIHLADSNRSGGIVGEILALAGQRQIEVQRHSREALARISRNKRQDQGVAADLACPKYRHYEDFLQESADRPFRLLALDRITNPQNLGMIIRSVCASPLDGLLLPRRGCAPLSPLVIKASAGTLFRCPILRCEELTEALDRFAERGTTICCMSGDGDEGLNRYRNAGSEIFVLGNETDGVSPEVVARANRRIHIPMCNGVESLNVAVTAALIAFRDVIATNR